MAIAIEIPAFDILPNVREALLVVGPHQSWYVLLRRGDTRNFRLHYAPFLETNVRDLSGLSKAVISYFCEDMMNYEGMQVRHLPLSS